MTYTVLMRLKTKLLNSVLDSDFIGINIHSYKNKNLCQLQKGDVGVENTSKQRHQSDVTMSHILTTLRTCFYVS